MPNADFKAAVAERTKELYSNLEDIVAEEIDESFSDARIAEAIGSVLSSRILQIVLDVSEERFAKASAFHRIEIDTPTAAYIESLMERMAETENMPAGFAEALVSRMESIESLPPMMLERVDVGFDSDILFLRRKCLNAEALRPLSLALSEALGDILPNLRLSKDGEIAPAMERSLAKGVAEGFSASIIDALQGLEQHVSCEIPLMERKISAASSIRILSEDGSSEPVSPSDYLLAFRETLEGQSLASRKSALFERLGIQAPAASVRPAKG